MEHYLEEKEFSFRLKLLTARKAHSLERRTEPHCPGLISPKRGFKATH